MQLKVGNLYKWVHKSDGNAFVDLKFKAHTIENPQGKIFTVLEDISNGTNICYKIFFDEKVIMLTYHTYSEMGNFLLNFIHFIET